MSKPLVTIVEGITNPLLFQLLQGNTPINLTGATVTLIISGTDGQVIPNPNIVVVDTTNGKVQYTPLTTDLSSTKSPYFARFKIVNGPTTQYVPSGYRDEWNVVPL